MAYDGRIYRILIASPSDVEEEREIAVSVIQQWNDLNSYSRKVVLLPLRWETHTAPDYGTRPQEVINRAIVDQCDLLVGVFWTRIGSPTGMAESGTFEEIERVGEAGKPIMLYFSKVEIDPDRIEFNQISKLREFKKKTYPKGLVESYKSLIDFRDKFAKQIEIKVREIQRSDALGTIPLSLQFLNLENGEPMGAEARRLFDYISVSNMTSIARSDRKKIKRYIDQAIRSAAALPLALVIENSSSSGIRNVYVELDFVAESEAVELSASAPDPLVPPQRNRLLAASWGTSTEWFTDNWMTKNRTTVELEEKLSRFRADTLQKTEQGWRLCFEWEALQPQRTRLVRPIIYVSSSLSSKIIITAKIFADSFPEPLTLEANLGIQAKPHSLPLDDIVPFWQELIKEDEDG